MSQTRLILTFIGIAAAGAAAVVAWQDGSSGSGPSISSTRSLARPQNLVVHTSATLAAADREASAAATKAR